MVSNIRFFSRVHSPRARCEESVFSGYRRSLKPAATQASHFNNFGLVEMKVLVRVKNKIGKESRKSLNNKNE